MQFFHSRNLLQSLTLLVLLLSAQLSQARSYTYTLSWDNPRTHFYEMEMRVEGANENFARLQVPAWRPGRYYLQDYGAGIRNFSAVDADGKALPWEREDGHTWLVKNDKASSFTVRYRFYANLHDAGSSVLNAEMAYFNPVNFFMHLRDMYAVPCTLKIPQQGDWKAATALQKDPQETGTYYAKDYHELVDSPTLLSPTLKTLHSRIGETDYYFHFQGKFPNEKAIEDAVQTNFGKIIREQVAIFGEAPMEEYHFIYLLSGKSMRHAVEHGRSSMYALPDKLTASPEAVRGFSGITAHEFFHLWNVKRIRPAELWPYDYQREQYTRLHWLTEGVTDYYAYLTLVRAGLIDREAYFKLLCYNLRALENNPASWQVSPAEASFNSWLDRSNYHPPFTRVSYYSLGTRVGFLLDLKIRAMSRGKKSLDHLFKALYRSCYLQDKGVEEGFLVEQASKLAGKPLDDFFAAYVEGTEKIPYQEFLTPFGLVLEVYERNDAPWFKIGLSKVEPSEEGLRIKALIPESDAEKAGLAVGDLIKEVNGKAFADFDSEDFFYDWYKGKELKLKVETASGSIEAQVEWTGSLTEKEFQIQELPKLKPQQRKRLEGWLESKVG